MKIVKARLVKRATADGLLEFMPQVPIGKIYEIDIKSRRLTDMFNIEQGLRHSKEVVNEAHGGGWLCMELLEVIEDESIHKNFVDSDADLSDIQTVPQERVA